MFNAVVGLTAGLGGTPLIICGDLQHELGRHLDFALNQGWLTDLGQTHKFAGAAQPLHTYEQGDTKTRLDFSLVNEAFRPAVRDLEVVQRNLVPKHKGLKITLTLDSYEQKVWMMRQPATLNAEDQQLLSEKMETGEPREQQSAKKKKERSDEQSPASDHGRLCTVNADPDSSDTKIRSVQGQSSEILPGHKKAGSPNQERLAKLLSM